MHPRMRLPASKRRETAAARPLSASGNRREPTGNPVDGPVSGLWANPARAGRVSADQAPAEAEGHGVRPVGGA